MPDDTKKTVIYRVTIERERYEEKVIGKQWKPGAGENGEDYGYTPEVISTEPVKREIYSQEVEDLNLVDVINAVNNRDSDA